MAILNANGRVNLAQVRTVLAAAKALGVKSDALVARLDLKAGDWANPDTRVPLDTMRRLWHELLQETARPDIALQLSTCAHPATFGVVGQLVMSCTTLGEALRMLQRYFSLLTDDGLFELRPVGGNTRVLLTLAPVEDVVAWRCAVEWSLGSLLACSRALIQEPLRPLLARFNFAAPEHQRAYREVFGCPLKFESPQAALELHSSDLARPVFSADRGLQPLLEGRAENQVRALGERASTAERARAFLHALPPGRTATVAEAARALAVSVRTLARRLAAERTSYQGLLDEHRRQTCCRLLSQPGYTIEEVAFLAGYSELSTFHRAFKRWTRQTPAEFRRAAQPVRGDPPRAGG